MPAAWARCTVAGCLSAASTLAASLSMTGCGVPAGANSATQDSSWYSGRPASAVVGTSGSMGWRLGLVTARAFSLPVCTWPITDGGVVMKTCTLPASTSWMAAPDPRYGTWNIAAPVCCLKTSVPRWDSEPTPCDA
ncbi:hypothetical protein D9M70_608290 [compost metagenome]